MKPTNIILEGVTGSTAYGLATENSDVDIKGVYLLPTRDILKLNFNPQKTTIDHTDPDWVYHEVGKFMSLVLSGNPTVTELLYLNEYTERTAIGDLLIANRDLFLSTPAVMNAYRGYAFSQAKRLNNRTEQGLDGYDSALKKRFAKHTRHCFRLLLQARQLLETGTLQVKVAPEEREWLFYMGEQDVDTVVTTFMQLDTEFDLIDSVLPDKPNIDKLNELLYDIRLKYDPSNGRRITRVDYDG
jgi:predicted nucleotidyltransferase